MAGDLGCWRGLKMKVGLMGLAFVAMSAWLNTASAQPPVVDHRPSMQSSMPTSQESASGVAAWTQSPRIDPIATPTEGNCGASTVCDSSSNFAIFGGFDGARGPDDLGINANVGGRFGVNYAAPLIEEAGIGFQIGTAGAYQQTATRFQRLNGGPGDRTQWFSTIGVFQRTELGFVWGVAYDYLHTNSYANFDLSQWRGQIGLRVNPNNEIGVWGTYHDRGDTATFGGERFNYQALNQASLYFTHFFEHNAMGRVWVGLTDEHGRAILGIPGGTPTYNAFIYGAEFLAPVNPYVAFYGEATIITPVDSGCVNAFVGLAIYPGGGAYQAARSRFAPMFPLANNANFAVDARR